MKLHDLKPAPGARKVAKRVGRGPGSGSGKTSGRGHKGQKSRSGSRTRRGFEGGQMPLNRRIPKRGFTNIWRKEYRVLNVARLNAFEAGSIVGPEAMQQAGMLRKGRNEVKVLGTGDLGVALTVQAHRFTKSAIQKIEAAGGKAEPISIEAERS